MQNQIFHLYKTDKYGGQQVIKLTFSPAKNKTEWVQVMDIHNYTLRKVYVNNTEKYLLRPDPTLPVETHIFRPTNATNLLVLDSGSPDEEMPEYFRRGHQLISAEQYEQKKSEILKTLSDNVFSVIKTLRRKRA